MSSRMSNIDPKYNIRGTSKANGSSQVLDYGSGIRVNVNKNGSDDSFANTGHNLDLRNDRSVVNNSDSDGAAHEQQLIHHGGDSNQN